MKKLNDRKDTQELEFVSDPEKSQTDFIRSLDTITCDELGPLRPKPRMKAKRVVSIILGIVSRLICVCVLIWGLCTVMLNIGGYAKGDKLYSELFGFFNGDDTSLSELTESALVRSTAAGKTVSTSVSLSEIRRMKLENTEIVINDDDGETAQYKAKLEWLSRINPDIYGWITIDGCDVNYPIVRGEDNSYYLDHAYTGEYMIVGSIFADYRTNDKIINNYNTVIYGHNMENGSMFHAVELMHDDEELFDSARIFIYTLDGIFEYAPISVYKTDSRDQYFRMRFLSVKEFTDFADDILEKSVWPRSADFTEADRILTLSTCTNEEYSGRFALHARLIDVTEFD